MAKNANKNTETVEQPLDDVQTVQGAAESSDNTQAATGQPEADEKKLQVSPEGGSGKQTHGEGSSKVDSQDKVETTGAEGSETFVQLEESEETTERRNKIAKSVFNKNTVCKVLYFTGELIPFYDRNDAIRNAKSLKDDTIVTINRE